MVTLHFSILFNANETSNRPMYPEDIRHMAHIILYYAILHCYFGLAMCNPRLEFATNNEYKLWLKEQSKVIFENLPFPGLHHLLLGVSKYESTLIQDLLSSLEGLGNDLKNLPNG